MSELEDGKPLSQVVKAAKSLGFTEPGFYTSYITFAWNDFLASKSYGYQEADMHICMLRYIFALLRNRDLDIIKLEIITLIIHYRNGFVTIFLAIYMTVQLRLSFSFTKNIRKIFCFQSNSALTWVLCNLFHLLNVHRSVNRFQAKKISRHFVVFTVLYLHLYLTSRY